MYGYFHFCFDSFLTTCAQTIITCHQESFLVPSMLVSYYQHRAFIALQCVQAITILQRVDALG
jgi:hypothetical protein